ncbi:hypothetical protein [Rosistilla ulvae]|nr:hypothetical protein [Rosistilla ulvae]
MAKRANSMASTITEYLVENPEITWKDAAATLEPKGISESYFSNQKSKLRKEGVLPSSGRKKAGRKPAAAKSTAAKKSTAKKPAVAGGELASAAEFARTAGGLSEARRLLDQLGDVQI